MRIMIEINPRGPLSISLAHFQSAFSLRTTIVQCKGGVT